MVYASHLIPHWLREHKLPSYQIDISLYSNFLDLHKLGLKTLKKLFNQRHIGQQWWMTRGGICTITARISIFQQLFTSWRSQTLYINKLLLKSTMIFNKNGFLWKSTVKSTSRGTRDQKKDSWDCLFWGYIWHLDVYSGSNKPNTEFRFSISVTFLMQLRSTQYKMHNSVLQEKKKLNKKTPENPKCLSEQYCRTSVQKKKKKKKNHIFPTNNLHDFQERKTTAKHISPDHKRKQISIYNGEEHTEK